MSPARTRMGDGRIHVQRPLMIAVIPQAPQGITDPVRVQGTLGPTSCIGPRTCKPDHRNDDGGCGRGCRVPARNETLDSGDCGPPGAY